MIIPLAPLPLFCVASPPPSPAKAELGHPIHS